MNKTYISCTTLDDWFDGYDPEQGGWVLAGIIDDLKNALTESHILMIDALDEDQERFQTINDALVSALRDLTQLKKEVAKIIKKGDLLRQGVVPDND